MEEIGIVLQEKVRML